MMSSIGRAGNETFPGSGDDSGTGRTRREHPSKPTALQRRVLVGGSVGHFVDFYDFTLYGLTAVIISQRFFPSESAALSLLSTFAAFGVAFVIRPLGGLYFGALGDRVGRRRVLFITLTAMGGATAVMGLLPGYEEIGPLAPVLLILCRLVQGFSTGGESVGAPSFVFEHAPIDKRGYWINVTIAATALPSVAAGTLILLLSRSMSDQSFTSWGWRIPFLLALPLALVGLFIRSKTEESDVFRVAEAERPKEFHPIREAFYENKLRMVQVVFVVGLSAMGFSFLAGYFVSYLQTSGNLSREMSLEVSIGALALYAVLIPLSGRVADRLGRKPMLIAGSAMLAAISIPAFVLVTSGNVLLALSGQFLFVVALCVYGGGCYTFFVEIFATRTRFTSAAIGYNVAYAVFAGTAPFIATALIGITNVPAAPGFYMAAAAAIVLLLVISTNIPETRGRVG
ncbi:MFS transporter [Rhodococcus sp. WMMA185]|uniref:MFS transporter n=1 Tax=Rhodococcus sp. WMMA185 TaxID=679318 RepID=UPI00087838A8|nr:MFS transporter [Rhodococcus sp. WMMA185]AOW93830.1 MFS transporter [Rhodococcus sp. WMMA185]